MSDSIMDNANKLNIDKLSVLLRKKGFSVALWYDTYDKRQRTFLHAWRNGENHAFVFRDWTTDIQLGPNNHFSQNIYVTSTMPEDIVTARILAESCWEE